MNSCQIIVLLILFGAPAALLVNFIARPDPGSGLALALVAALLCAFVLLAHWYRRALSSRYQHEQSRG
jgi:hypothetical protein